ncbi:MAG: phosphoglucosamine mutase [Alphaproteobacteria bacterium]|nr:phosphoglucosamine mutase [Alphaproteobacteria bacterium]
MALKISISGIRGEIGKKDGLNPLNIVKFAAAYGSWLIQKNQAQKIKIVIGRDGRLSGKMVQDMVQQTLVALGIDCIDLGLSTTPTVAFTVGNHQTQGGIIITASHNPIQWNALKLLNHDGEFLQENDILSIQNLALNGWETIEFIEDPVLLGKITYYEQALDEHIDAILKLPGICTTKIKAQNFKIVVDVINSSGAVVIPKLCKALGVEDVQLIADNNMGLFEHNPEPLPEHLKSLQEAVIQNGSDLGVAVDPDVDRICFVQNNGDFFGEEYSLVAISDYFLNYQKGHVVTNLSSTMALHEIAEQHKVKAFSAKVGEAHVVAKMKLVQATIGGEGNGGIIVSQLHYGRDALVGLALFLSYMAESNLTSSEIRKKYPFYPMSKTKIQINPSISGTLKLTAFKNYLPFDTTDYTLNEEDGLKIILNDGWLHLRESNTEPIIRIIAEAQTHERLTTYLEAIQKAFKKFLNHEYNI